MATRQAGSCSCVAVEPVRRAISIACACRLRYAGEQALAIEAEHVAGAVRVSRADSAVAICQAVAAVTLTARRTRLLDATAHVITGLEALASVIPTLSVVDLLAEA